MKRSIIVLDGVRQRPDKALLQRLIPGIRKRQGVFETILFKEGRGHEFEEHFRRLSLGLKSLKISPPWSRQALDVYLRRLLGGLSLKRSAYRVRVMVWVVQKRRHWAVVGEPFVPPKASLYRKGVDVLVVRVRRALGKEAGLYKSLDYGVYRRASDKAIQQGFFDALLVDKTGCVIDGGRTSLIVLTNNEIVIPRAGYGTFDGVMRRRLVQLARRAGVAVGYRPVLLKDLYHARMCWLANSLIGLIPVAQFQ